MISGMQIRCARSALRWSVQELAARSKVSTSTIKRIEAQNGMPSATFANVSALKSTFESAGITFVGTTDEAPGIRLQPTR